MNNTQTLIIATRKSPLALWQANFVKDQLETLHPELSVELLPLSTKGDKILDSPLAKIGGKGLFVKELEEALLDGRADIAVHSMKDVPMHLPEGLTLGPILERHDPTDALVSNDYDSLEALPEGAILGSSSLRRICQLKKVRPDLNIKSLRGNIHTRLEKLDAGEFAAIILASSGLKRMGLDDRITALLPTFMSLPACGQGALSIELRAEDETIQSLVSPLHHEASAACVNAERAMNTKLNGGCQVPIAGFAEIIEGKLHMRGLVGSVKTNELIEVSGEADTEDAVQLGESIAEQLLEKGAGKYLAEANIDGYEGYA